MERRSRHELPHPLYTLLLPVTGCPLVRADGDEQVQRFQINVGRRIVVAGEPALSLRRRNAQRLCEAGLAAHGRGRAAKRLSMYRASAHSPRICRKLWAAVAVFAS